jgi:hypothetical protein
MTERSARQLTKTAVEVVGRVKGDDWVSRQEVVKCVALRRSRVGIKFINPINHTQRVGFPKYQNTEKEPKHNNAALFIRN